MGSRFVFGLKIALGALALGALTFGLIIWIVVMPEESSSSENNQPFFEEPPIDGDDYQPNQSNTYDHYENGRLKPSILRDGVPGVPGSPSDED